MADRPTREERATIVRDLDWTGYSREMIIEVIWEERDGKKLPKITFSGFWRPSHPDVKDVPRGKVPEQLPAPWWEAEDDGDDYEF